MLLFWLFTMASLVERREGLLDGSDQRSQAAQRGFREITVSMDQAKLLPLNELPGLVL